MIYSLLHCDEQSETHVDGQPRCWTRQGRILQGWSLPVVLQQARIYGWRRHASGKWICPGCRQAKGDWVRETPGLSDE